MVRYPVERATVAQIDGWHAMIGKKVWKNPKTTSKFEPKPFKSGRKANTVKDVCVHDHTSHLAFIFEEDSTSVECFRCSLAPEDRYEEDGKTLLETHIPKTADGLQSVDL